MDLVFSRIHTKLKFFLGAKRRVYSANEINEVATNKQVKILLSNITALKKQRPEEMAIGYVRRDPVDHLEVTSDKAAGIQKSLNFIMDHGTAFGLRMPRSKATDLSLAVPNEETSNFMSTIQKLLLFRPV